jgi:hypothetical protein
VNQAFPLQITEKYIYDLESTKASEFSQEAIAWTADTLECPTCSPVFTVPSKSCYGAGTKVLSGPDILANASNRTFSRTYATTPQNDLITVALQIDLWIFSNVPQVMPDLFVPMISLNDTYLWEYNVTKIGSCETVGYTGSGGVIVDAIYHYRLMAFDYLVGLPSSAMVQIQDLNAEDTKNLSVGFRDLKIYLNASECFVPETFPCCNSSTWNGTDCNTCDPSCYACKGPRADQCTICIDKYWTYPDGSCGSTCEYPFVQNTNKSKDYKLCESPCSSLDSYIADNQTCRDTCPPYMLSSETHGLKRCMIPCSSSDYFFETDKICKSACEDSPYESMEFEGIKVCYLAFALSIQEVQQTKAMAASIASQGAATGTGMKASSAMNSNSPSIVLLASLCGMLNYIKYMRINYPDKLKLLFFLQSGSPISISFSVGMPQSVSDLKLQNLPENFKQYNLHTNFLYNYWDTLITIAIIMAIIFCFFVLQGVTPKGSRARSIFTVILGSLKWNIPLMILSGSFGDMFFYASIHLRIPVFQTLVDIVSHFLCIGMVILGLTILLVSYKSVEELRKKRDSRNSIDYEKAQEKWKNYKFLFEEYEDKYFIGHCFMTLFLFRVMLFNIIVANLFEYPLAQAIAINVLNISIFCYLVYLRPIKALFETFQMFVNEVLFLVANICMLILAIMDAADIQGLQTRNQLGQAIILINVMFPTVSLALLGVQVLLACVSFYKFQKRLKAQGITSYYQMLKIYLSGAFPSSKKNSAKVLPVEETSQKITLQEEDSSRISLQNSSVIQGSQRINEKDHSLILARGHYKRRQKSRLSPEMRGDESISLDNSRLPINHVLTFDSRSKGMEKDKIFQSLDGLNSEIQMSAREKSPDFL